MKNTISVIAAWHMKSEMLKEQNSQFVLIHIWLAVCLKALDGIKKTDLLFNVGHKLNLNNSCERLTLQDSPFYLLKGD